MMSVGQKLRRNVVTKLDVGGMIVWKPFESDPTARSSGSQLWPSAIPVYISPSRDVFHPCCAVHNVERLRPATLIVAPFAPRRETNRPGTVYVAESSRSFMKPALYVPGASASSDR